MGAMRGLHRLLALLIAATIAVACSKESEPAKTEARAAETTRGETTKAPAAATKTAKTTPWPRWPKTTAETTALLQSHTGRARGKDHVNGLDAQGLLAKIVAAQQQRQLIAGWTAIGSALHALAPGPRETSPTYYLFGTFHDAGGQVAAFRRLVGPGGFGDRSTVPLEIVAEQLDATGQWRDVPPATQGGDDTLLTAYRRDGSASSYAALWARQRKLDYTAWKYRYLHDVLGLIVDARASGRRLHPCDMPRALQARARKIVIGDGLLRLRELHCLMALHHRLQSQGQEPRRVAMLWGQDHVGPHGVQRLLPPRARAIAIYLFGHRPGPHGLEGMLARRLALTHPLLVPLDGLPLDGVPASSKRTYRQLALLLPGPRLAARWNQTRDPGSTDAKQGRTPLRVLLEQAGELLLPGRKHALKAQRPLWVAAPEPPTFILRTKGAKGLLIAGSLALLGEGQLELEVDVQRRRVEALLRTP